MLKVIHLTLCLVLLTGGSAVGVASNPGCETYVDWFKVEATGQGYEIRARNPDQMQRFAEDARRSLARAPVEELAGVAGATVVYVQEGAGVGSFLWPLPVDGVWSGADPLSAAQSFCRAGGLDVRVAQEGVWLVGPPADLDVSAVVAFTYPIANDSQRRLDPDEERALLRDLPVRRWQAYSDQEDEPDLRWIALGYFRHPTEPGVVMLMVTEGVEPHYSGIVGSLMKAVLEETPSGPAARCVWQSPGCGQAAPHFAEDVDGDGVSDFLLTAHGCGGWRGRGDSLVSGADGRRLAEFAAELVAVEQRPSGPRRIAVKHVMTEGDHPLARLLTFSEEADALVVMATEADQEALRKQAEGKPERPDHSRQVVGLLHARADLLGSVQNFQPVVVGAQIDTAARHSRRCHQASV